MKKTLVPCPIALPLTAAILLFAVAGCQRDDARVYRVDKKDSAPPLPDTTLTNPGTELPPGHPDLPPAAAAAPLTWTTPAGWTEATPTEIRVASFKINQDGKQADVSVIPLGGMAGGDDANVNRWRGQVGLPPVASEELKKAAEPVEVDGQAGSLYDVAGTNPAAGEASRIIGVIQHREDTAWFFKMTGDDTLVEAQKPAFIAFLKSVKILENVPPANGLPASALPPGHPALGAMPGGMGNTAVDTSAPISKDGQPNWDVPTGWKEVSGGQFLVAKFLLSNGDAAAAAVNVSRSAGNGGGLAANVNRWRGQLGLTPVVDVMTSPVTIATGSAVMVDLNGTNPQTRQLARLVGVIVTQGEDTWIYKLMGDAAVVESQKDAFLKFVQGVKY